VGLKGETGGARAEPQEPVHRGREVPASAGTNGFGSGSAHSLPLIPANAGISEQGTVGESRRGAD